MKTQKTIGIILILSGVALLWFFVRNPVELGETIVQVVVYSLILSLLLAATPLRKKVTILLIFGIVWFGCAGWMSFNRFNEEKASRETGQSISGSLDSLSSFKEISADNAPSGDESVADLWKNYMSNVQKIHKEFSNEMISAGLNTMLSPENIINIDKAKQARAFIKKLTQSIPDYEYKILGESYKFEEALSIRKDRYSQLFYEGYLKTKQHGIQTTRQYFALEKKIVDTIGDILDLSIDRVGKINMQEGLLLFEDEESLNLYNEYLAQLGDLSKQEEKIVTEQQQRMEQSKLNLSKTM